MARGFPYPDLKDFLAALERAGELRRVPVPVDPTLEISEITTRTVRAGGPALLFEKPTRGQMPVAINLFGTHRRMAMALGVGDVEEIGARNLGLYRLHQHSHDTLGMHWQIHKDSTAHHAVAERRGERLPVAIAFGCDPVVSYAATAPLPADIDEYLFAGFLRGERVEMVECLTVPLQVPAHAQVILEGYVEPGERHPEGQFGAHTGFYTPVEPFPVLHVTKMTAQRDPVYHSIITSKPPQEDGGIGHATERIFLPLIKMLIPDIVDMALPEPGIFHNCLIVSLAKRYPKHAQKVMNAIWGAHLLSLTKLIVVVDEDCDPHDYHEVAFRAFG